MREGAIGLLANQSFLWVHWFPCFRLLVMSPLGFKARVGSLICTWQRHMWHMFPEIYLWYDTCWPLGGQHGSQAIFIHILLSRHWWGLRLWSIMLLPYVWNETDALLTEPCQLGWLINVNYLKIICWHLTISWHNQPCYLVEYENTVTLSYSIY